MTGQLDPTPENRDAYAQTNKSTAETASPVSSPSFIRSVRRLKATIAFPVCLVGVTSTPCLGIEPANSVWIAHHAFGRLDLGGSSLHTLNWTNRSSAAFEADHVETSCECLQVLAFDSRVPSGGVLSVQFRLAPSSPGSFNYTASIAGKADSPTLLADFDAQVIESGAKHSSVAPPPVPAISPAELLSGTLALTNTLLADVRPQRRYVLAHIPGSVNLGLAELRSGRAYRHKDLLLIGDGQDTAPLSAQAARLIRLGQKRVAVLDGGVRGWQYAGGTLVGTSVGTAQPFTLPASELVPLLGLTNWIWFNVEGDARTAASPSIQLPTVHDCTADELRARLYPLLLPPAQVSGIVVIDQDGSGYGAIEAQTSAERLPPRFYVEGGATALVEMMLHSTHRAGQAWGSIANGDDPRVVRTAGAARGRSCCGGTK